MKKYVILVYAFAGFITVVAAANTYHVAINGDDLADGTGWGTNAIRTISKGIALASAGDIILVSNGVYLLSAQLELNNTDTTLQSVNGAELTIIDGGNNVRCLNINAAGASINGFTFRNGNTAGNGGGIQSAQYGGTIVNSMIISNESTSHGGGIYIYGNSFAGVISNCMFQGNVTGGTGGGIYTRYKNTITHSSFINNHADQSSGTAGGVYLRDADASMSYCIVMGNTSRDFGGGIQTRSAGVIRNCLIANNSSLSGGGVSCGNGALKLESCTIVGNTATKTDSSQGGGGIGLYSGGSHTIVNTIIYNNSSGNTRSNIWLNGTDTLYATNACFAPTNSVGSDGTLVVESITAQLPLLDEHYRLTTGSPCINAGLYQSWMNNALDLDGHQRRDRFSGQVDMGCYEYLPCGMVYSVR